MLPVVRPIGRRAGQTRAAPARSGGGCLGTHHADEGTLMRGHQMAEGKPTTTTSNRVGRVRRQAALRGGAALGVAGAVLAAAAPAAAHSGRRTLHLEVDFTPVEPVSLVRAGSGPPQRGDFFYVDAPVFAAGGVGGAPIGTYECFGAWTRAAADTGAPDQRLTTVQFNLAEQGVLHGLINEGGANGNEHVGTIQGGSGRFAGAVGTFRQVALTASPGAAVPPGVNRAVFDLLLPDALPGALPRTGS
jgi:hypothetical protein